LQESGDQGDSVVDLLFQPEKCFTSKSALLVMKLVHGALKVCLALHSYVFFVCVLLIHRHSFTDENYCSVHHGMHSSLSCVH